MIGVGVGVKSWSVRLGHLCMLWEALLGIDDGLSSGGGNSGCETVVCLEGTLIFGFGHQEECANKKEARKASVHSVPVSPTDTCSDVRGEDGENATNDGLTSGLHGENIRTLV